MSYSERLNTLKTNIDSLVTYSNETTGESDTTISDAVGHLVAGYGGGSGTVMTGTITPSSDSQTLTVTGLTSEPHTVLLRTTNLSSFTLDSTRTVYCTIISNVWDGAPDRASSTKTYGLGKTIYSSSGSSSSSAIYYESSSSLVTTENSFKITAPSSIQKFRSGLTYEWFAY